MIPMEIIARIRSDFPTKFFNHPACCYCCTTCRKKVIHNQSLLSWLDGILMHEQFIGTIFKIIFTGNRLTWQFARFSDRHKTNAEFSRNRRTKDKTSALWSNNDIRTCFFRKIRKTPCGFTECFPIRNERCHITKQNTLSREIPDRSNIVFKVECHSTNPPKSKYKCIIQQIVLNAFPQSQADS